MEQRIEQKQTKGVEMTKLIPILPSCSYHIDDFLMTLPPTVRRQNPIHPCTKGKFVSVRVDQSCDF